MKKLSFIRQYRRCTEVDNGDFTSLCNSSFEKKKKKLSSSLKTKHVLKFNHPSQEYLCISKKDFPKTCKLISAN